MSFYNGSFTILINAIVGGSLPVDSFAVVVAVRVAAAAVDVLAVVVVNLVSPAGSRRVNISRKPNVRLNRSRC